MHELELLRLTKHSPPFIIFSIFTLLLVSASSWLIVCVSLKIFPQLGPSPVKYIWIYSDLNISRYLRFIRQGNIMEILFLTPISWSQEFRRLLAEVRAGQAAVEASDITCTSDWAVQDRHQLGVSPRGHGRGANIFTFENIFRTHNIWMLIVSFTKVWDAVTNNEAINFVKSKMENRYKLVENIIVTEKYVHIHKNITNKQTCFQHTFCKCLILGTGWFSATFVKSC